GDVLTGNDKCAIGDGTQNPPCPQTGTLATAANGVSEWGAHGDAADQIPSTASRTLFVSRSDTTFDTKPSRWFNSGGSTSIVRGDIGLDTAPDAELAKAPYRLTAPVSNTTRDNLTLDVVSHVAGCNFGTRLGSTCVTRTSDGVVSLLGDIFHSNPLVLGSPNA